MAKKLIIIIIVFCLSVIILFVGYLIISTGPQGPITLVMGTEDMVVSQDFSFTISPDDQWVVYFNSKGLKVLNLVSGEGYTEDPNEVVRDDDGVAWGVGLKNNCWSDDGRYCVAPVYYHSIKYEQKSSVCHQNDKEVPCTGNIPHVVIDHAEENRENEPSLLVDLTAKPVKFINQYSCSLYVCPPGPKSQNLKIKDINPAGSFTCSDCESLSSLYPQGISDKQFDQIIGNGYIFNRTDVEKNGSHYYVQGNGEKKVEIIQKDSQGKVTKTFSDNGWIRGVSVGYLTPAPNGIYLAFQREKVLGSFVSPPELLVVNLNTRKVSSLAKNVYYDMHWSADSKRLYFYNCQKGGQCSNQEGLKYVEFK